MKMTLVFSMLWLVSCGIKKKNEDIYSIDTNFIHILHEKNVGGSYKISIPDEYALTQEDGPDFMVYYFSPQDSTITPEYSGGIYMGFYPSLFGPSSDSCTREIKGIEMFGEMHGWNIYCCSDSLYFAETLVGKNHSDLNLHLFGHAVGRKNLFKLMDIFSTLKKR